MTVIEPVFSLMLNTPVGAVKDLPSFSMEMILKVDLYFSGKSVGTADT